MKQYAIAYFTNSSSLLLEVDGISSIYETKDFNNTPPVLRIKSKRIVHKTGETDKIEIIKDEKTGNIGYRDTMLRALFNVSYVYYFYINRENLQEFESDDDALLWYEVKK